ncbi:hypothetical protein DPEC_G00238280 [Dallia pectoralis]|uniref:Uncharacterized protein n=1 Tax=Dallia pectoralis TaxID=75939 RepID=A0ACC2FZ67_DALPE|nr:hypothetical protein DPEC_G00238280 [Dallia pectoralis]
MYTIHITLEFHLAARLYISQPPRPCSLSNLTISISSGQRLSASLPANEGMTARRIGGRRLWSIRGPLRRAPTRLAVYDLTWQAGRSLTGDISVHHVLLSECRADTGPMET